jgi:ubiquinone/menaquinone biosynthesis C-methylase UbiE
VNERIRGAIKRRIASTTDMSDESRWFWDHYEFAPNQILSFANDCGLSLEGRDVADIGCGDGIMALGVCTGGRPTRLVGFDIVPTNTEVLAARARGERVLDGDLPAQLEFRQSSPQQTPAQDAEFDFVYSWSAFEHVLEPISVLSEIRRILRPEGHFFLQLWPFFHSPKGSHLWDWYDDEFHHLKSTGREVVDQLAESDRHPPDLTSYMSREFEHLNRITVDELQRSVLAAGFEVRRLELITTPVILTPDLGRYAWTDLAIGGIKFLAVPRP